LAPPVLGIEELGDDVLPEQPARRLTATVVHSAAENKRIRKSPPSM
jgi:hypothetical protein